MGTRSRGALGELWGALGVPAQPAHPAHAPRTASSPRDTAPHPSAQVLAMLLGLCNAWAGHASHFWL